MIILMLSLDQKILDPSSGVASRMIEYGKTDELYIVIPSSSNTVLDLSKTVHVFGSGGVGRLGRWLNTRRISAKLLNEKPIALITSQDPFFLGLIARQLSHKFNLPHEIQIHGDFFASHYYRRSSLASLKKYYLGKFITRHADQVRVVSERVYQSVINLGVAKNKIVKRPVKASEVADNYQPKFKLHEKYPEFNQIFLVLGRLDPVKNVAWLIKLFKPVVSKNRNAGLVIVGSGIEEQTLKTLVKSLGLEQNIKFESYTNDPASYLKTADALLFPSLSEGYGLVAVEAAALKTPLIMNDVGVANYELKSNSKVKILPINDKQKWLEAILNI